MDDKNTKLYGQETAEHNTKQDIINLVYVALSERGYNAIDQMVGYILSGDPSYITSHRNARNIITRVDRDDLIEELLSNYLGKK